VCQRDNGTASYFKKSPKITSDSLRSGSSLDLSPLGADHLEGFHKSLEAGILTWRYQLTVFKK
jgi:hypothetical protein